MALLVGAITAVAVSPARAHHTRGNGGCCEPCPSATTAPATRTITVTECVPEWYTVKRTAYRVECRTETYDTCRTECVPVWRERVCTVTRKVPVWREEVRKVCKNVTTYEDRTVMRTSYKYVQETCMRKELVRLGHWECETVCRRNILGGGLFGGRGGHGHHGNGCCDSGCGDPCATSCDNSCNVSVRTRKRWVACPEYRECPVTVCKKVCVQEPVVCKVAVCRPVWTECRVKVCTYECRTEQQVQKYCVMTTRSVPCKATRTVRVCVPYEVEQKCCRMVARTVTREVACAPACPTACEPTCCETSCRRGLFSGRRLFSGRGHGCCDTGCRDTACCR